MSAEDYIDIYDYCDAEYWSQNDEPTRRKSTYKFREAKPMAKKMTPASINQYYVGAKHISEDIANGRNDAWTHKSLDAAVAHGKKIIEAENVDVVTIVKIVRIIRRQAQPVIVEKL